MASMLQSLMNQQLTNNRSPFPNFSVPSYPSQKEGTSGNGLNKDQGQTNGGSGSISARSTKDTSWNNNNVEMPKTPNNTGYMRGNTEGLVLRPTAKYNPLNLSSFSSSSNHGFPSFPNKFPSNPNDNLKASDNNLGNPISSSQKLSFQSGSPIQRAPRMSEPLQLNSPPPMLKSKSIQETANDSSQQKKYKDPSLFLKSKPSDSTPAEQQKGAANKLQGIQVGISRQKIWSKTSMGKKPRFTVADFKKIKQLGAGKYGKVSLVKQRNSGFVCALKMMEKKLIKDEGISEQFIRQLKIQMYLNHPNIIKTYGYFEDQTYIYIILEAGTGGQLFHQLQKSQPMPQARVALIMKQVCEAVNELHSHRIIHRDIKPENIVLHENVVKLCDFGWSVYLDNKLRSTFCGTPLYVCPQILKGKQYDEKIDIWSLGIMMYEMVVGESPFKITKEEELIKIVKDEISIPTYVFVSKEARDFMDKCLKKNPANRCAIKQLLNHEFFAKNQEKKMAL